ncbi:MAG: T9SS type A sorting domain-containing protein [Bacteroidales bacterium]|nr:T9SS type A sorting domain-containing protein [Bacteroidales bacterium]
MKKLLLSIVMLALAMFCGAQSPCWDGTVADVYAGGDGTPENPYQIANAAQLALLAEQTNNGIGGDACYILTDDICLNENVGSDSHNWMPIGLLVDSYNKDFKGVFDGNGHTINNLYLDNVDGLFCLGLFGRTNNAVIKNVNISNAYITSSLEQGGTLTGLIAGNAINTDVSNCTVDGSIQSYGCLGGIIGECETTKVNDTTYIVNCINNAIFSDEARIGGIIGDLSRLDHVNSWLVIENCVNYSDINSKMHCGGIAAQVHKNAVIKKCENFGKIQSSIICGGIVGSSGSNTSVYPNCILEDCVNHEGAEITGCMIGGIVGKSGLAIITRCINDASITGLIMDDDYMGIGATFIGGITGTGGAISNCYNRGDLTAIKTGVMEFDEVYIGGIVGVDETEFEAHSFNVYNTGNIIPPVGPSIQEYGYGNIVGYSYHPDENYYNCYWLEGNGFPACGNEEMQEHPDLPGSCSFVQGATPTSWILSEAQYGTTDLLEALNAGSLGQCTWLEDVTGINDGYPVFDMAGQPDYQLVGDEWYYEITNALGEIYYQHLEYVCDTTIDDKKVKVIVKTNSLYDLRIDEQPVLEYIYEENNRVYWWDKTSQEFTVLYDFGANPGDEWVVSAGGNNITMHVDDVWYYVKDARWFKALTVSDENDVFSGTILCGIGHLTSFFPEKLLDGKADSEVDGLRCYWKDDVLILKEGDVDCDYIYNDNHLGVDENETPAFTVYPNPAKDAVTIDCDPVEMRFITSQIELMDIHGQLMKIRVQDNQIDVSYLPNGIYFIKIGNGIVKLIINR